jgi:hypothetical protein
MFDPFNRSSAETRAIRPQLDPPSSAPATVGGAGDSSGRQALWEPTAAIAGYDIESVIASGGMGVVYRARNRATGEAVAVKTLRRDLRPTPDLVARFRREAQADIPHPNVMPVLDAGESLGRPYLVMPLAVASLAERSVHYRKPEAAAALMAKVARGVDAAHRAGILHRDLKPGNVLMSASGEPLVADFGLAKLVEDLDTLSLTATGAIVGTAQYMSPEQAWGVKADVGPASDVWSLGVMLYELVTGERPFDGSSREATLERIRKVDPPPPRAYLPQIDRRLEAIILACLEKKPGDRYQSAGALADDIDTWRDGGEPWAARRLGWREWARRRLKQYRPAVGAAVAFLLAILAMYFFGAGLISPKAVDKPAEVGQLLAASDAGQQVNLIPRGRWPIHQLWRLGDPQTGRIDISPAGNLIVESQRYDLLELLPRAPKRFQIDAVFRRIKSVPSNHAGYGIFAALRKAIKQNDKERSGEATVLVSVDGFGMNRGPTEYFGARSFALGGIPMTCYDSLPYPRTGPRFREPDDRVVSMRLRMDADGVRGRVNGRDLGPMPWREVSAALDMLKETGPLPAATPPLDPTGPVGIFMSHGVAEILSFTLTPLSEENRP